ncbi:MAG: mandelate racemase/muconate lactonizing enzyme family protein [Nitratireductor sp.]
MGLSIPEFRIESVKAVVLRAPIPVPVRTSFGTMRDRPAVFVRVDDDRGRHGYGEIWCNFPTVAAEHRKRLVDEIVGPALMEMKPDGKTAPFDRLMDRLHVLALQSGEWGPLRQVAAGLDAAVHDLAARRAGLPLFRYLNPAASGDIAVYASGIGPETPGATAERARKGGHAAFKVKVGFGRDTDLASLTAIRQAIGPHTRLMADANQGWTLEEAAARVADYAAFDLTWIEEPLRADRPLREWSDLAARSPIPIAAGENLNGRAEFDAMMQSSALTFVQPDVAKWGGVSGCYDIAAAAAGCETVYCPHFLGGGIGLAAPAHLLAAEGGGGMLEIDVNPNPLRDEVAGAMLRPNDGRLCLPDRPGIGITPDELFS